MDTIINKALELICSHGVNGLSLSLLWRHLHAPISSSGLTVCDSVKRAVLSGLSAAPGILFKTRDGSEFNPKSKPFEEFDKLELKVFGDENLRKCFVGLYDVKSSQITPREMRVLELLARARETGVTQSQLSKELGVASKNFFYVVKRLETWGLIVRHSTIVRTKEATSNKEPKSSQPEHTNLIHLHRYAPPLSSHQRFEITKKSNNSEDSHVDNVTEDDAILDKCDQDDVDVKDFLPALKAVCDRLEQAKGKVLVVSDIKKELGYRERRGHRTWGNVCNRLQQAGLIEIFEANVNSEVEIPTGSKKRKSRGQKKPVSCLKLVGKFSPKLFEHKTTDCEHGITSDQNIASRKQAQNTDQLVELPLEQQIVDMIDAEGSKGLLGIEVCKRLGISNRMFEKQGKTIVPQFGLHQLSEACGKGSAYRFWTPRNFCPKHPNSSPVRLEKDPSRGENSKRTTPLADYLNSQSWLTEENTENNVVGDELKNGAQEDRGTRNMVIQAGCSDNVASDIATFPHAVEGGWSNSLVEAPDCPVPKQLNLQQGQLYPSVTSATRKLRILERLETEKIIIRSELQHWLENFQDLTMDRRTLHRCLINLEAEGLCRLMRFNMPGVSNYGSHRLIRVVLHPSVEGSASDLSEQVRDKLRFIKMENRSAVSQLKKDIPVPVLHGIERIQMNSTPDVRKSKLEAMCANGFVIGKIIRTKLLHCFLWDYVHNLASCIDVQAPIEHVNGPSKRSCPLFSLDTAIKAMPLELFLQVVGSPLKWKDMIEKCQNGLLLSDFSNEEYKYLMDTQATRRVSQLTDILRRLKLIRLVADESPDDATTNSHATLKYALDLKPYIEEPPLIDALPGCSGSVDLRPNFRHDFVLSTTEALEKYWQTLEKCYAGANPKAAVHAFPGSVAYEVIRVYYDNRQHHQGKSQRKRKRVSEGSSGKHVMVNYPTDSLEVGEDDHEEQEPSFGECIMPILKQARQSKFSWTEEADRQLIIQYARRRARQGARRGTDWSLIRNLPADSKICRRRLATLLTNDNFRNSLMRLCKLLTQRYAQQYLDSERNSMLDDNSEELNSLGKRWDDFEDSKIKAALHEVLMLKKMVKLDPPKRTASDFQGPHDPIASTPCELENGSKYLKEGSSVNKQVHLSLAVSSAIELLKLGFLTKSKSVDKPDFLEETFRQYSKKDINSAFAYLRQNKFLAGSDPSFCLSERFYRNILSEFPTDTGKGADKLASLIHENEKKLMEGVVNLPSDLQCGDIYQLIALVSSGKLSISPALPHEGVGEAEDSRSSKRKYDDREYDNFDMSNPFQESEICSRREKGFPGITVSLSRTTILRSNVVELFKDDDRNFLSSENDHFYATLDQKSNCVKSSIYHSKESPDFDSIIPTTIISGDSIWEVMANYIHEKFPDNSDRANSSIRPELIKSTYINIQKAGDQGLSMSELSKSICNLGTTVSEHIINVLELYGFVLKVNGYNNVQVVDGLYRTKYFLTSKPSSQDPEILLSEIMAKEGVNHGHEINCLNEDDVHKVTILNLPQDSWQHSNAIQGEVCSKTTSIGGSLKNRSLDETTAFYPILPWMNRDGSINGIVYEGLRRRILGIVTQNPGILEDGILRQMNVLNPQSGRKLLEVMVLDKHLFLRKMSQRTSPTTAPSLLERLVGNHLKKPRYVCREHYFANPMSTALL